MNPSRYLLAAILVVSVLLATACQSGEDSTIGGELRILNWDDYFAPTTIEDFEAEFGIDVLLDTFEDEQAMLAIIQSDPSQYDVIIASDSVITDMIDLRLLAQLDPGSVPNLANIDPEFNSPVWDTGNQYSVPYTWGSTGIVYNTKFLDTPATSWSILRDPSLAGHVALLNDPTLVLGLTLMSLGYPLNSSDDEQIEHAVSTLRAQSPLLAGFLGPTAIMDGIVSEELWAAQVYNGDASFIMEENEDMAFFIPDEGSDIWVDNLAIPRDASNKAAAQIFLNYILRPDVHAEISNYTGFASPNLAALEEGLIDVELLEDEVSYPSREGLEWWQPFDAERTSLWNKAWADVQAASPPASD